jgi:Dyp-type peroxidase family
MGTDTTSRKRSTGLAGLTNLSVLAPLRPGMVPGLEPISYVGRLRKVLEALQSARQNLRESELLGSFFPDVIGRLGIIHNFRYALVAPESGPNGLPPEFGTWRLSLNVSFDGGWEPYMRAIYRDIGTLLDLLFCHSPDYPGSHTASFEAYCAWVRKYEVPSGLFYADSSLTLGDQHYLQAIEKKQRVGGAGDAELAQVSLPSDVEQHRDAMLLAEAHAEQALVLPLRTLKGLYRLSTYFPKGAGSDDGDLGVLRRFAQAVLREPIELMHVADHLPADDPVGKLWRAAKEKLYRDELEWLQWERVGPTKKTTPPIAETANMQSHILSTGERMTHGCLVLLRITDPGRAAGTLARLAPRCGPLQSIGDIGHLFAFTYEGLKKLGVAEERLRAFPQEFVEGMEARCAILGDVRSNHPDRWTRPLQQNLSSRQRLDLRTVHMLVHLRLAGDDNDESFEVHPQLQLAVQDLEDRDDERTGLRVVAVEPLRSYRQMFGTTERVSGHFGIADGISQPQLRTSQAVEERKAYSDLVSPGELLLGGATDRGDRANEGIEGLLKGGTFLVVRKLRQHMDQLAKVFEGRESERDALMEKMMGRKLDGSPLVSQPAGATDPNDFDFTDRGASEGCPFQSHARRANPRDGRSYTPRILRRGMSYGPRVKADAALDADRGVMFMAYCASIAEQFETLQRWIAGGNSSGVGSAQADPLLRVPQENQQDVFRYLGSGGLTERLALGDKPLVQLQWGLYAFVPSLSTLRALTEFRTPPEPVQPARTEPGDPVEAEREKLREMLEDRDRSAHSWQLVRDGDTRVPQVSAYGTLLGRADEVLRVLKDDGREFSVRGYAARMNDSLGLNLLGMDPGAARDRQLPVSEVLSGVDEQQAFDTTQLMIAAVLEKFPKLPGIEGDIERRPIDLVNYSDAILAALCHAWFGLPDGKFMVAGGRVPDHEGEPRCPGDVNHPSRYIFGSNPRETVAAGGRKWGKALRAAADQWLATTPPPTLPPLAQKIKEALASTHAQADLAANLVGLILGFTPTVQGNFLRVMETWIHDEESLWEQQQLLYEHSPGDSLSYAEANAALRAPLYAAMRKNPVPDMLWRSPGEHHTLGLDPHKPVVLGMRSALVDPQAPDELVFGRDDRKGQATVHGCPGYKMGMGILLAMIGGLLKAGTLRPTGSPVLLILTPRR